LDAQEEKGAFVKLHCDTRFQRAFTACGWVFDLIQTACSKLTLKTRVATQLKVGHFSTLTDLFVVIFPAKDSFVYKLYGKSHSSIRV